MDRTADASTARIEIRTRREGVLSRVGHDLALDATRFELTLADDALTVRVDADAVRVRCALRGDHEDRGALSASDRAQIDASVRDAVLDAAAHPWVLFRAVIPEGFGEGALRGELTLRGVTRPLSLEVTRRGAALAVRATVRQRDFGLRPFTAFMGALRVRDEVEVIATVPWG